LTCRLTLFNTWDWDYKEQPASIWGKGFGTEMAAASVQVAFKELDLRDLVAFTIAEQYCLAQVMEKVGLR
jgi:RimJ/RimL family protein N-acetyltransferase